MSLPRYMGFGPEYAQAYRLLTPQSSDIFTRLPSFGLRRSRQPSTITGTIIGRRRCFSPTHLPTTRRATWDKWCVSVTPSRNANSSASRSPGKISSKTVWSSPKPRACISGPAITFPTLMSTAATTERKPSSPRIRRSFSNVSVTSPTLDPSTYT